jgi:hypothetical protein
LLRFEGRFGRRVPLAKIGQFLLSDILGIILETLGRRHGVEVNTHLADMKFHAAFRAKILPCQWQGKPAQRGAAAETFNVVRHILPVIPRF